MKVVIPYARNRIAYSILKSLSAAGYQCYTADCITLPMCRFSRHSEGFMKYPDPQQHPTEFRLWSHEMFCRGYTVFPTFTESWVLRKLGFMHDALPEYDVIMRANDKWEVHKLCKELEIPTPATELILNDAVIKPRTLRGADGRYYVEANSLLQYRVPGFAVGVGMLFNRGVLKAKFAWKRLEEYPRDGGTSVVRESAHFPIREHYAEQLLAALQWHGVAMVEFKGPWVLEINPRFWGSLQLAVDSGVDFPKLLLQLMTTGDCDSTLDWETGVRTSWLAGCLRRGCRPRGNVEDFSLGDPLPFVAQFASAGLNFLRGNGLVLDST